MHHGVDLYRKVLPAIGAPESHVRMSALFDICPVTECTTYTFRPTLFYKPLLCHLVVWKHTGEFNELDTLAERRTWARCATAHLFAYWPQDSRFLMRSQV